jgi:osmotically-inducible protein OsmY
MYKFSYIFVLIFLIAACTSTPARESTGEFIDSGLITAKIKAKIADDPVISVFDIKVDTFKSVVHLSGFVKNTEQKQRAEQIAWSVEGVKNVKNGIVIESQ